ncbi:MAG: RcnB family protein [Hyphomonadaceae bacterium]
MKKLMIATVAAVTGLAPIMAPAAQALTPRGDHDRYDRGDRRGDRDDRRDHRVRSNRDNGFWANGRFYRGNPSILQQRARDFRYDRRDWRRGERLSPYERARYHRVADYRRYRLHAPPRGYEWRRSDSGEFILAAVATGVILSVILAAANN